MIRICVRIALYQPDIQKNTGTLLRMAACLGVAVDIIGTCGFDFSDRALRRAGLDYIDAVELQRHVSFDSFEAWRLRTGSRLVLATTQAEQSYCQLKFRPGDIVMLGRETAGVPEGVHTAADQEVRVPMREGMRSLNVAIAGAMIVGEALRQLGEPSA